MPVYQEHLIRFKEGNEKSFSYFFEAHWDEMYSVSYRHLQDEDLAKDIVQETFIHLWERRHLIDINYPSLKPYLLKAVKNKIFNYFTSEKARKQILDQVLLRMQVFIDEQDYTFKDYQNMENKLDTSIAKLPSMIKAVYILRADNTSISEIAEKLNIAEQTVKNYLTEARIRLKADLKQQLTDENLLLLFILHSVFY